MSASRPLFPHPVTSVLLLVVWLLLQQSLSAGHLLLGTLLAVVVPLFAQRFWPEQVRLGSPVTALRFLGVVLWDILVANFSVARVVLGPASGIQPGFVRLPLDLENDFAITVLASTVSLTPGTVSAELSADRRHLIIHYLACDDEDELMRSVKQRYETPLKEIFPVLTFALFAAKSMLSVALLLNLWRLWRGPDSVDRALALDTLYINTVALLLVYGIELGSGLFYEAALLIALLGFIGTVSLAKFLLRGDVIE